jgi:hypothetical protein
VSNITDRLNKVLGTLNSRTIAIEAHKKFVSVTPIRSGNARRKTRLNNTTIDANYPYAQRLEDNYSEQTRGKGMIQPTLDHIRDYVFQKTGIKIK